MVDVGVGQDETITGGPLEYGPLSFIYLFGSASMRLGGNQNLAPLILTVPMGNMVPTIPSPNVSVLSFQQPNRDFYRIGVGLNLLDVFSKLRSGPTSANASK